MPPLITNHPAALRLLMNDDLYCIVESINKKPYQQANPFTYQGSNRQYILLIFEDKAKEFLDGEDITMLQNMLRAKGQSLADVAILNIHKNPHADFKRLKAFFICRQIVLFGVHPSRLSMPAVTSHKINMQDQVTIFPTYSIEELRTNLNKKRLFWNLMKSL